MSGKLLFQVRGVDIDHIILPHNTGSNTMVTERNVKTASLVVDEAVKGYLPFGAQVEQQSRVHLQSVDLLCTSAVMQFLWHPGGGLVVSVILSVAPL